MGEGEAVVDHQVALGHPEADMGAVASLVEMGKGGGVGNVKGFGVEVLKDELVGGALDEG